MKLRVFVCGCVRLCVCLNVSVCVYVRGFEYECSCVRVRLCAYVCDCFRLGVLCACYLFVFMRVFVCA